MLTCRTSLMIACATSALLVGMASTSVALAADLPTKKAEPVPVMLDPGWYTEGVIEVGGRFFVNHPDRGNMPAMGRSLAKYYQFSTIKPGPFSDVFLAAGTNDGARRVEIFGNNIGYSDQAFGLHVDHIGKYYFNFLWDQTPNVISTGAQTIYGGIGTNNLWLPAGLPAALRAACGNTNPITAAAAAACRAMLTANSHQTDLGTRRETASGDFRWTPNDAWDVRAEFSNIHRDGTLIDGISFTAGTSGVVTQAPMPVNDDTKNFGLNAEYAGQSPWERPFTFKLGYNGSIYTDNNKYYTVQNPFCAVGDVICARTSAPMALVSLPPNNSANGVTGTLALELPWKARSVTTFSWTRMQQNDPFLPFWTGGALSAGFGATGAPVYPAASLNGLVDTFLLNNVVTKQFTPDLKGKLTYRYYDFANRTPELFFNNWIVTDINGAKATTAQYAPVRSLSMSYVKQNAAAELDWRPLKSVHVGGVGGWEHYSWTREAATGTDEISGKLFADWKPSTWFNARANALLARRYSHNYNYYANLGGFQWATPPGSFPNAGSVWNNQDFRAFYLSGRIRSKADIQASVTVIPNFVVTPSFAYINDYYPMPDQRGMIPTAAQNWSQLYQEGLNWAKTMQSGVDISWTPVKNLKLFGFYMFEKTSRGYQGGSPGNVNVLNVSQMQKISNGEAVQTFRAGFDAAVIPERFDVKGAFTIAHGRASQNLPLVTGVTPATFINYPDVVTNLMRAEVDAKYTFSDGWLHQMGLKGKLSARLNYTWEHNSVTNWQASTINYMYNPALTTVGYMTWLGYNNPNYNIHRLGASMAYKW